MSPIFIERFVVPINRRPFGTALKGWLNGGHPSTTWGSLIQSRGLWKIHFLLLECYHGKDEFLRFYGVPSFRESSLDITLCHVLRFLERGCESSREISSRLFSSFSISVPSVSRCSLRAHPNGYLSGLAARTKRKIINRPNAFRVCRICMLDFVIRLSVDVESISLDLFRPRLANFL